MSNCTTERCESNAFCQCATFEMRNGIYNPVTRIPVIVRNPLFFKKQRSLQKILRKKLGSKEKCKVCSHPKAGLYYNGITCHNCRSFFRRCVVLGNTYSCRNGKNTCSIYYDLYPSCAGCRLNKCLKVGMRPDWVSLKNQAQKIIPRSNGRTDQLFEIGNKQLSNGLSHLDATKASTGSFKSVTSN